MLVIISEMNHHHCSTYDILRKIHQTEREEQAQIVSYLKSQIASLLTGKPKNTEFQKKKNNDCIQI